MTFSDHILEHLIPAMLVIVRIGGLVIFAPVLGSSSVPVRIRVLILVGLSLAVYPGILGGGGLGTLPELELFTLAAAIAVEITIGAFIGFLAAIPLLAGQTGGFIVGQQMGLGFAQFFDPTLEDDADVIGQLTYLFTLTLFLIIGGHEVLLLTVMKSFDHIAVAGPLHGMSMVDAMTGILTAGFELALRVATPVLAIIMLETIAMGFIAKTVPQLNILSLGFPIRMLAGWFILIIGLVVIKQVLVDGLDDGLDMIQDWIIGARGGLNG